MNILKKSASVVLSVVLSSFVLPSWAQGAALTSGVVRKIDLENSKVTIRHEEIQHLDMPPMTMVFTVKNKTLLDKLQPGQTVKFDVVDEGGKLVITQLKAGEQ
jgi:Cu/Ag efflux protein CusF